MIDKATIERIKDSAQIEDVIGEFVSLTKRGANYVACCPFHDEKTPSFSVSPSRGIYKCFGCGKAGDSVNFLMEHEHFSYPEALRFLAAKYHIQIEEQELTEDQKRANSERDSLYHVSEFAQKYFAHLLYNDELGKAIGLSYFHQERNLSDKVIQDFGLGYCVDEWSNFTDHALKNGYSREVLEKTGLTIFKEDGKAFDRFKGRVMFPIYSISGRVLGFSGRILSSDKSMAKYVNSPDSAIYNKSNTLYGLYQARTAISKADKCYLTEGNIDVISMHQSGVENTVASCGTSLTKEQIRLIKRYTRNVTVLYDGDAAGIKAAIRAFDMLFEEEMHVRVVLFPDGEDPDSYARKYGSTQLQDYLNTHEENFVLFKANLLLNDIMGDPIRKVEAVKEIVRTIALVPDLLERNEYVCQCASLVQVSEQDLATQVATTMRNNRRKAYEEEQRRKEKEALLAPQEPEPELRGLPTLPSPTQSDLRIEPEEYLEMKIIQLLINYGPNILGYVDDDINQPIRVQQMIVNEILEDEMQFKNPAYKGIFSNFVKAQERNEVLSCNDFLSHPNPLIKKVAVGLIDYESGLSPEWANKGILTAPLETRMQQDVIESLLNFKLIKIDNMIKECDERMQFAMTEEDQNLAMAERIKLNGFKVQLGQRLKRVIH